MAERKGAYGTAASDTDFRKKYDRAEYAEKARVREAAEKEEGKLRYEAKLAGKKYYAPLTGDETLTEARKSRLDVAGNVGKISLLPAGAATGKRGRGAGFWCEACDLTFKDNLQWVEVSFSVLDCDGGEMLIVCSMRIVCNISARSDRQAKSSARLQKRYTSALSGSGRRWRKSERET